MNTGEIIFVIILYGAIALVCAWSIKRIWNWLSKKEFDVTEKHKWLKILISVLCGTVFSVFVLFGGIIKIIHKVGDELTV